MQVQNFPNKYILKSIEGWLYFQNSLNNGKLKLKYGILIDKKLPLYKNISCKK